MVSSSLMPCQVMTTAGLVASCLIHLLSSATAAKRQSCCQKINGETLNDPIKDYPFQTVPQTIYQPLIYSNHKVFTTWAALTSNKAVKCKNTLNFSIKKNRELVDEYNQKIEDNLLQAHGSPGFKALQFIRRMETALQAPNGTNTEGLA